MRLVYHRDDSTSPPTMLVLVMAPTFSFNHLSPSRPPRHAGGPWEGFDGGLAYHSACVVLQLLFFPFFPGFIALPFRGVGVGAEEPHLRLMI